MRKICRTGIHKEGQQFEQRMKLKSKTVKKTYHYAKTSNITYQSKFAH